MKNQNKCHISEELEKCVMVLKIAIELNALKDVFFYFYNIANRTILSFYEPNVLFVDQAAEIC